MRYLDAYWAQARLAVEIDGAQHMDPQQHWDDMSRDNDLIVDGYRVLRFPAWLVRHQPAVAAERIREALARSAAPARCEVETGCIPPRVS
jgi:very-short-patch-repair endonuclease